MKTKFLAAISLFILIAVSAALAQVPERKGLWKFDDPSNLSKAEIGAPLELAGSILSVDGPKAGNKAVEIAKGSYLLMTHGISPNGGGSMVNEYTMQIDFLIPEAGVWHSFFQLDPTNASDAELFANTSNSVGVAETGYSAKGLSANTWYRMVVSVKNGEFFRIYIDGSLWLDGSVRDVDSRFALLSSVLMFADNDGDDATIQCSELGIWDIALNEDEALALGGATGERVPVRTKLGWWKFDDPTHILDAELGSPLQLVGTQQSVAGPSEDNKAIKLGADSYLKMTHGLFPNGGGTLVNEYSLQIDFLIPDATLLHSFLQTDAANATEAQLFTNSTNAIGSAGTNYSSNTISANNWYRMIISVKNGEFFKVYMNGELWLDAAGQAVDGKYALSDVLLLFADNSGKSGNIVCSELSIWEVALNETEIADIGSNPTIQIPQRVGRWEFEDTNNLDKATIGNNLTQTGTIYSVNGPVAGNKAVEISSGSYLTMMHGIYGNGDGYMVNEYTLQIDFLIPQAGIWHAFFQTEPENLSDADLFTNMDNAIGTGATSYTANTISANTWYRMVITVRNGSFFRIYINGVNWLDAAGQQVDGRFALASELLLFADNDGEDGLIDCSEVSIWDVALTAEQVAKLGDATTQVTALQDHLPMPNAELGQNYPNPFTTSTIIPYQVTQTADVCFRLLDDQGNEVRVINEGTKSAGKYTLTLFSGNLKSGNYILQMTANKKVTTRKLILVK